MQFHLILFEECRLSDGVGNLGTETGSDPVFAFPLPPPAPSSYHPNGVRKWIASLCTLLLSFTIKIRKLLN